MDDLAQHVWEIGCAINRSYADEAEAHQLQLEREQMILHALQDCRAYGAPAERLDVLARELGVRDQWRKLCR